MGTRGLTRRGLAVGLVTTAMPVVASPETPDQTAWKLLAGQLEEAQQKQVAAAARLYQAEKRFFALPRRQRRRGEPDWYIATQQAEATAGDRVEGLSLRIAQTRAPGREGLALKVGLLAAAYGIVSEDAESGEKESEDLVSRLIRSLIIDLS